MDRWVGKVAVVTGASSGIGSAIVVDLANAGMRVIGLARRVERVDKLKSKVKKTPTGELHGFKCDISREEDILAAFKWINAKFGGVDVLVNNAGVMRLDTTLLARDNSAAIRQVLDTNVTAVVFCTREAFHSMISRNVDGHVVLINSVGGHRVPNIPGMSMNIYPPSKFAITAITEVLRQEFQNEGTKIKVTVSLNLLQFFFFNFKMFL